MSVCTSPALRLKFLFYLMPLQAEESSDVDSRSKVRLIVPNSSCGGIIGKGGSTIKYNFVLAMLYLNFYTMFSH